MKVLVYGAGAIGCHIGYCMHQSGHEVSLLTRGEHYNCLKKKGMRIKICNNDKLISDKLLTENEKLNFINDLSSLEDKHFDYIFITVKLNDYNEKIFLEISPFLKDDTAIIPPCTKIPFWWLYNLEGDDVKKFNNLEIDSATSKFFRKESIIGMTMWLSSVIESPGNIIVKHIQRGYPLKEVFPRMKDKADKLRASIQSSCLSPEVDNIKSELFIKSINSLAFNMVALDTGFNNAELKKNKSSIDAIKNIMFEGEKLTKKINLPITQSIDDRINQTLSSTAHTMSMLNDYQNKKKPELNYLWESFKSLSKILEVEMVFTDLLYQKVAKKIYSKNN